MKINPDGIYVIEGRALLILLRVQLRLANFNRQEPGEAYDLSKELWTILDNAFEYEEEKRNDT